MESGGSLKVHLMPSVSVKRFTLYPVAGCMCFDNLAICCTGANDLFVMKGFDSPLLLKFSLHC